MVNTEIRLIIIFTPKIMASSPITSWQIDGETVKTVSDFNFLGSKITADGDCSHEIKRCLLLGRKVLTKPESTLKSKDVTLSAMVRLVKAMVFPVAMYGCESWTIKKPECCWRGCGEKGTLLHCWWECKLIQPLWRTVWRFLF